MKCHVCGSPMNAIRTDLPFKVSEKTIVVVKGLPVSQCVRCPVYELDDNTMMRVDEILKSVNNEAELEIIRFAA
ncbi:MAG: YgiT-type zinc finger protein [Candidatus Eremiobacteraeota bacterium]|nr:YgiT-type zinc finger protein [Candidatus Eremiobacteraeota bacterium]